MGPAEGSGDGTSGGTTSATATSSGTGGGETTGLATSSEGTTVQGTEGDDVTPSEADSGEGSPGTDASAEGEDDAEESSGTGATEVCETVLCGDEETCCGADEDCVLGACVDACDSGVRCGAAQDVCCGASQVCLAFECTDPGQDCLDSFDCPLGEFCEPTLGRCLPQTDPIACELIPEFEELQAAEEWSYQDDQIISIPVVADIDGDGDPEVVLNLTQQAVSNSDWIHGRIIVLDGVTGELEWPTEDPAPALYDSHGRSTIGLADVSGDALPDIIYAGRQGGGNRSSIFAVDGFGNQLWTSHNADDSAHTFVVVNGAPSFANFDDDDASEIVFGASLIDDDGLVVWDEGGNGAVYGSPGSYQGGISAIADLDGDHHPEIISGRNAWSVAWTDEGGVPSVTVTPFWTAPGSDGYPAIADLDVDGDPEVVIVAQGRVTIVEGATGRLWCGVDPTGALCDADDTLRTQPVDIPGGGRGGPPTIADFDGDSRPEIAAAGSSSYTLYDLARSGEDIVVPDGDPAPEDGAIFVRWSKTTQDESSNATGSSVFDFQGDGAAEVVYADECYLRVYDGSTGDVILETPNTSATIHEYPLVVDVDRDGNSEILIVANDSNASGNCPGHPTRRGLFVYGDVFDQWVGTRRVWTSHTYHVTNVTSAGNVPAVESDNWTDPSLNNYRQNVQGEGVFNAPDLSVQLVAELSACGRNELQIVATVRNEGSLGVPADVPVSLYRGTDAGGTLVSTQPTTRALLPGQEVELTWTLAFPPGYEPLELFVTVDGQAQSGGRVAECNEANNDASSVTAFCPVPG